LSYGCIT